MAEYICIGCGEAQESDKPCSCPKCGYKMYPAPYDRCQVLLREIRTFVGLLRVRREPTALLYLYRKELLGEEAEKEDVRISKAEDDTRFPDFDRIQSYVCGADRTERFLERLNNALRQLRGHLHRPFQAVYQVDPQPLLERTEKLDAVLMAVQRELSLKTALPPLKLPDMKMSCSEAPDGALLSLADEVLDRLEQLSDKLRRFVKRNNIYGFAHQYKPQKSDKPLCQDEDPAAALRMEADALDRTLAKNYTIDVFSDGTGELQEMLRALWKAVAVLMAAPVLKLHRLLVMPDGREYPDEAADEALLALIRERFAALDAQLLADSSLAGQNEEELFTLYNRMIELDSLGLMEIDRHSLSLPGESERKLDALIGLRTVKDSIRKIKAFAAANSGTADLNLHMCFYGNPGTGKTEVARIIAGILHENKILPTDKVIEVDRSGLVGEYVGETPQKTLEQIHRAMGGVLFIDEAYALVPRDGSFDYGHEAVATLLKAMEDYRGQFCVILAGYRSQMQEMLSSNPGFRSRIQFELDFPNYSRDELRQILEQMLRRRGYSASGEAVERMLDVTDVRRRDPSFANAREVRSQLEQVIMCQNLRCVGTEERGIGLADVNRYIRDSHISLPTAGSAPASGILTAEEELERLIGLAPVKRTIKKIKAYAKRNRDAADFNLHMCFYGNPGTGKTEVARLLSRILYDAGVLAEAKLVETDAHGLTGRYVGETAPKTRDKVQEAMGGVLFVDEAYGLVDGASADGTSKSYGDEAIAVLLKEMEDRRGQFCVILAGYQRPMQTMLGSNPGLRSRIQFTLEFPDYNRQELGEIAVSFLGRKGYEIDGDALEKLLDISDYYRRQPDFANARTVRGILDQVIMNQNLRTEDDGQPDSQIILSAVEDYITDEGLDLSAPGGTVRKIGFT